MDVFFRVDKEHRAHVPVVGLPYADHAIVKDQLHVGSRLTLIPVDDNPHDPSAIEVWFKTEAGKAEHRIGFVPREFTRGLRLALSAGELASDVPVACAEPLSFSVDADLLQAFVKVTMPAPVQASQGEAQETESTEALFARAMAGYRPFVPEDGIDPSRMLHQDTEERLSCIVQRLLETSPDMSKFDAYTAALEELSEEAEVVDMVQKSALLDPSYEAPCARPKLGGLPYAEAGWAWPICPECGHDMVFVAQAFDPATPTDLVQAFHCADPEENFCEDAAQDDLENGGLLRIWRNPDPSACSPIAPSEEDRLLPAHRFDAPDLKAKGEAPITFGGPANGLAHQNLTDDGFHCVMEIWLPDTAGDILHVEPLVVVRLRNGRAVAWADCG